MNLKNHGPIFIPDQYRAEFEKLSKAALMDLVWDYAQSCAAGDVMQDENTMREFRKRSEIILTHRKNDAATPHAADCGCWRCDRKRRERAA